MLELRPNCECCNIDLPNESLDARICTYECTFCATCAGEKLANICPNCGGELVRRPIRPADRLLKHPMSSTRVFKSEGCASMTARRLIPPSVRPMWDEYIAAIGEDRSADFYEPFYFHNNEKGALALAELVLRGVKRGSASLVWTYEYENKAPPRTRSLSVMTDWGGKPMGIIETLQIVAVPFEEVTAEFAAIEGEGDGSLRYWSEGHWNYFLRECARIGKEPSPRMLVYCEQFELVFPRGPRAS